MSEANAEKFLDDAEKDPKLRKAVQDNPGQIKATANAHGYDFTHEHLQTAVKKRFGADVVHDDPDTCCVCIP